MIFSVYIDPVLGDARALVDGEGSGGSGAGLIAGDGLVIAGGTITADVADVGFGLELSGGTASYARYRAVETVTGATVTLMAGHAYKAYATTSAVTLNTEAVPANQFGQEGHLEIFVAGTGYVVTGANVVLANALEPDAVNNCTVRFHDGVAIISVEDHIAGDVVISATGSTAGTLPYALSSATQEYVAFDASLNGQILDMSGAVTNMEKHLVGNSYADTILTGGVTCTSKTTFANLTMSGVVNSGGTMTLGDVYIPAGGTVSVSGGGLAFEKVTGDGGTIDLGGTNVGIASGSTAYASGCKITGGSAALGGAFHLLSDANIVLTGVEVTGCSAGGGGVTATDNRNSVSLISCYIHDNTEDGGTVAAAGSSTILISGCIFGGNQRINPASPATKVELIGWNTIGFIMGSGTVIISSGAILDLTGNTNPKPIAPGGGITFEEGGATVLTGATAGVVDAQYSMDNIELPAGAKLTNTAVVDLNQTCVRVASGAAVSAAGVSFVNGSNANTTTGGGAFIVSSGGVSLHLSSVMIESCNAVRGGAIYTLNGGGIVTAIGCTFSGCSGSPRVIGQYGGELFLSGCSFTSNNTTSNTAAVGTRNGAKVTISGCTFDEPGLAVNLLSSTESAILLGSNSFKNQAINGSGSVTISSGAIIDLTGNTNTTPIDLGGGITFGANVTVVNSAGSSVLLNDGAAGSCSVIKNDGTIE